MEFKAMSHIPSAVNSRERINPWTLAWLDGCLVFSFSTLTVWEPAHEMVPPTLRMGIPISTTIKIIHNRYIHRQDLENSSLKISSHVDQDNSLKKPIQRALIKGN